MPVPAPVQDRVRGGAAVSEQLREGWVVRMPAVQRRWDVDLLFQQLDGVNVIDAAANATRPVGVGPVVEHGIEQDDGSGGCLDL